MGAGNRKAVLPERMLEELRWVATDYSAGDVVVFHSYTVHASLHNASEFFMRISVDFRYQQEGEDLTEGCLRPHFERLSWEDVYAGWKSDRFQYYWKDLNYRVVPFEDFDLVRAEGRQTDLDPREAFFEYEIDAFLAYERRRDARLQRRTERLGAMLGRDVGDPAPTG